MFQARFRAFRPRHPLLRLLAGAIGLVAVIALVTLGLFALVALAIGGALFMLVNAVRTPKRAPAAGADRPATPGIIEGEFSVVPGSPAPGRSPGSR